MAIDPICGMTVDEATALSATREGEHLYFCSEHCRQKFLGSESGDKPHTAHDHKGHDQKPASESQVPAKYTCRCIHRSSSRDRGNVRSAAWLWSRKLSGRLRWKTTPNCAV